MENLHKVLALTFDAVKFVLDRVNQTVCGEGCHRTMRVERIAKLGEPFKLILIEREGDALGHFVTTPNGVWTLERALKFATLPPSLWTTFHALATDSLIFLRSGLGFLIGAALSFPISVTPRALYSARILALEVNHLPLT